MLKFLSEFLGLNILLFQERALVAPVADYVVDPESGKILAFLTKGPFDKKLKAIPISHIKSVGAEIILIDSLDSLTEPEEIIKLKPAMEVGAKLIGEQVVTESNRNVGRVKDVTVNLADFRTEKLYITSSFSLKALTKELIIPMSKVVRIEKNKIIIKEINEAKKTYPVGAKVKNFPA